MKTLTHARKLQKSYELSSTRQFLLHSGDSSVNLTLLVSSNPPTWRRLISPTLPTNERMQLIMTTFSDCDEVEVFKYLSGNDAQAFVDVMDEASIRTIFPLENVLVESY